MGGWLYLATVIDIASRRIVGYAIADHLRTELVADALADAIAGRNPGPGVIFDSDRGCQGGFNGRRNTSTARSCDAGTQTAAAETLGYRSPAEFEQDNKIKKVARPSHQPCQSGATPAAVGCVRRGPAGGQRGEGAAATTATTSGVAGAP